MAYEIHYDKEKKIAELILSNPVCLEESKKAEREVVNACNGDNSKRILVDMEKIITNGSLTTFELYDLGVTWRHETGNGTIKYAIILPLDRKSREDIHFLITVSANRGTIIKSFDHRDEAVEWLTHAD